MASEATSPESPATQEPRPELRAEERVIAALAHFSALVPLWALVANALLLFTYRESSRAICFHARQGIQFQVLFLILSVPVLLMPLLKRLLTLTHVPQFLTAHLDQAAGWTLGIVYGLYAAFCLLGIVQALRGRFFMYPLVGRPLYRQMADAARANS
jgi:uncharacterized Tic20 family protein